MVTIFSLLESFLRNCLHGKEDHCKLKWNILLYFISNLLIGYCRSGDSLYFSYC